MDIDGVVASSVRFCLISNKPAYASTNIIVIQANGANLRKRLSANSLRDRNSLYLGKMGAKTKPLKTKNKSTIKKRLDDQPQLVAAT